MELTIGEILQQGITAHKEGKVQEAERLYRAIIQSQPAHPDANHNLGVLAVSLNKAELALPLFKIALEANPKIEQFWLSYIDAFIKEKQFETAKQIIQQAKMHGVAEEKLNVLETQLTPTVQVKTNNPSQQQISSLVEHYQNGRFNDAEKLAVSITQEFPKHQFGWKVLGVVFLQTGRKSEALNANQNAVALSPQDTEAHNSLGITLQELGRLEEAEASYTQAIALKPDYADFHYNLGVTLQDQGRLEEAEASYTQAIALKPDYAEAHYNLGTTLQKLVRLEEAEASYTQAIMLTPDYAEAHSNLGNTLQKLGRLEEAEASYTQAIELKPDYAESYSNLGNTMQELGRLEEAEASYTQAIELKPDYAEAHNNLGVTLQKLGRLEEAEASYKQAIAMKPDYAQAHYNLGITLKQLGRLDEAANAFRTSHNHDPASHLSLFNLHSTYYRDMNPDFGAAIKCLDEAVQIAPTDGSVNFFLGMLLDYTGQEEKSKRYFSLVQEDMPDSYAQLDSWSWVKSNTSQYPLLFWQKYDGFDYAFDAAQIDGLILEFGVAHGISIRRLASKTDQLIHGFDSFKGLPESWAHLPKGAFNRNGHVPLAPDHVKFHVGLFDQTLPAFLIKNEDPIKFLNIDCDLYSSTKTIFDLIEGRIVSGTVIFFDEYLGFKDWRNHEFKAFQEAVKRNGWLYDYLAINISGYNAVVIIR